MNNEKKLPHWSEAPEGYPVLLHLQRRGVEVPETRAWAVPTGANTYATACGNTWIALRIGTAGDGVSCWVAYHPEDLWEGSYPPPGVTCLITSHTSRVTLEATVFGYASHDSGRRAFLATLAIQAGTEGHLYAGWVDECEFAPLPEPPVAPFKMPAYGGRLPNLDRRPLPGTPIFTKDGTRCGNAHVILQKGETYICLTDAGNVMQLSAEEIAERFTVGDYRCNVKSVLDDFDRHAHFQNDEDQAALADLEADQASKCDQKDASNKAFQVALEACKPNGKVCESACQAAREALGVGKKAANGPASMTPEQKELFSFMCEFQDLRKLLVERIYGSDRIDRAEAVALYLIRVGFRKYPSGVPREFKVAKSSLMTHCVETLGMSPARARAITRILLEKEGYRLYPQD